MPEAAAIVNQDGALLLDEGPALPIYSIAKTFIACAVVQTGIDLQTPVARWIEARWLPDADGITVAHLLNHTAGLPDYTTLAAYGAAIDAHAPPWTDIEYAAKTLHQPRLFAPGERFAYSNPGYWLLKRVLELEHGQSWPDVLRALITGPLQLQSTQVVTGQFADDLPHYPAEWVWHGVITSRAADIARFMASDLIPPLLASPFAVHRPQPHWQDPHYGYGVMIEPGAMYGHNGGGPGYCASCFHFIHRGLTGCVLMSSEREDEAMLKLRQRIKQYR